MAIKVKAVERKLKFTKNENDPGVYRYVLGAELYTALNQKKVMIIYVICAGSVTWPVYGSYVIIA